MAVLEALVLDSSGYGCIRSSGTRLQVMAVLEALVLDSSGYGCIRSFGARLFRLWLY